MAIKILALLALTLSAAAGIGCAGNDGLQTRIDELTREQEDLQRQKEQAESEALAYKAKCEALERDAKQKPPPAVAPAPVPVKDEPTDLDIRRRGNETVINIPSDLFFASGSATLNGGGEKSMSRIVEYIRKNHAGGMIRVEGHSDSDPIRRTKSKFHCNWELSFQRAHAVMHFLTEKGQVDPHHVVCEAYGEYQPQTPGDKSKNRRVEIVLAR
jgi:flagellar motor protein MotB